MLNLGANHIQNSQICLFHLQGEMYQTYLFGLEPYTTYYIHIAAVNNAGQVASPWTSVRTLEASPSGLSNFTVDKKENGRALLLRWAEPSKPNGNIKVIESYFIKVERKHCGESHDVKAINALVP